MPHTNLPRLRLARSEGVGALTWRRLMGRFGGDAAAALDALPGLAEAGRRLAPAPAGPVLREIEALAAMGARLLFVDDPSYPALLARLPNAPAMLAVLGARDRLGPRAVALVGARAASTGGRRIAEALAEDLAKAGIVVVSGLARGIDAAAHTGALRGAGRTVAVVPGGLDIPYPRENAYLQDRIIAEGGAVVAEAPLGMAPLSRHFPARNRIVAGLSLGVVVVEAARNSGTLITARMGLEAGREIFAVPGSPLDPRSAGANDLIRQGAHLTETAEDVLDLLPEAPHDLPLAPARPMPMARVSPAPSAPFGQGAQLLELLGVEAMPVDEVLRRCHLSAAEARAVLLDLELEGLIEHLPGNRISRKNPG
ncbi:DNA processing protein [Humitalea rosea]|uniref:DNA processing protein n=1 Tax=Humitalea rosea TaxID=990373 RepID=A0A2W7IPL8_9PROT|nr:DNA-processing protein DprA [Humitalea rosea]PZW48034.1 DNA processing protein [Humitalea rosea]